MTFKEKLESIHACEEARLWVGDKSPQEVWDTCERGDWLLWWYERADNYDKRKAVLAAGHIANTVRHLMTDERSTRCVDVCIAYGEGRATDKELAAASAAARDAAWDAAWDAVWDAERAAARAAASAAARDANLKTSADLCRKYLPMPIFNDVNK